MNTSHYLQPCHRELWSHHKSQMRLMSIWILKNPKKYPAKEVVRTGSLFHLDWTWNLHPYLVSEGTIVLEGLSFWIYNKMEVLRTWSYEGSYGNLCRSISINTCILIRFQLIKHYCHCCFSWNRTLKIIPVPQNTMLCVCALTTDSIWTVATF